MGVKTSRQIGLNYGSSVAYIGTLIRRTKDLAAVYGVTSEVYRDKFKRIYLKPLVRL